MEAAWSSVAKSMPNYTKKRLNSTRRLPSTLLRATRRKYEEAPCGDRLVRRSDIPDAQRLSSFGLIDEAAIQFRPAPQDDLVDLATERPDSGIRITDVIGVCLVGFAKRPIDFYILGIHKASEF